MLGFGSVYRFLSSSIATELKLDLSRIDQAIAKDSGRSRNDCRTCLLGLNVHVGCRKARLHYTRDVLRV